MEFGMDFDQIATGPSRVVTRNDTEVPREFSSHFLQGCLNNIYPNFTINYQIVQTLNSKCYVNLKLCQMWIDSKSEESEETRNPILRKTEESS